MNTDRVQALREQMATGPVYGMFCKTPDAGVIEVLGGAGFDFVILDQEHGPASLETLQNLIRGAENAGIVPIVRVPSANLSAISQVLDLGAGGVQVPQITNESELR